MASAFLKIADIGNSLVFKKGPARLVEGETSARKFNDYFNQLLLPQIASGLIEECDIKLRFSGFDAKGPEDIVFAGPTSFQEYREAFNGQAPDLLKIARLKERGKNIARNEWALLARPIGLTAVVLDSTDAYILGQRMPNSAGKGVTEYGRYWDSPAGYLPFTTDLSSIDLPGLAWKFVERDYRIPRESLERIRPKLIAAQPDSGETDIALIVRTSLPKGFKVVPNPDKYSSVRRIEKRDAQDFLFRNNVKYSTAAVLSK
jgi:hypothetical protein